jgi:hypothetical protein
MRLVVVCGFLLPLWSGVLANGEDVRSLPRPVPLTRPVMKELLEDLKGRKPRIPVPKLTADQRQQLRDRAGSRAVVLSDNYEARLRHFYLPASDSMASYGFSREPDPNMTLDYMFKTELFWIVSRTNNCHYCLGHQEIKLAVAGLSEDEIAGLDGKWNQYTPAQQAAFAFARKLTFEPHRLADADIDALRPHFTDLQILEMIFSTSGNNAINRWKEGCGVPQEAEASRFLGRAGNPAPLSDHVLPIKSLVTPTSASFQNQITEVAPYLEVDRADRLEVPTRCVRPKLESADEVEQALAACRQRTPRLPLVEEAEARARVQDAWPTGPLPEWVRLLANFPAHGVARIKAGREADETGDLTALLKAQVSWVIARQDRAWYALGEAKRRLAALGQSDEEIAALDGDWTQYLRATRTLLTVAQKLAASPIVLTDADVDAALEANSPRDVVQLIQYTTNRASFNRITEAAGLRLED